MAVRSIRGRVVEKFSDPWGQWTSLTLQGKHQRKLLYVTAYQVCVRPTNKQGSTAYHQQEVLAQLDKRPTTNPRKNFHSDLRTFLQAKLLDKYSIILAGDFNEPSSTKNMQDLLSACDLIDVWEYRNSGLEFNTRHPGKNRIDYIVVTPDIIDAVQAIGYLPFHQQGHSDHRSLYLDFDTAKVFGHATNPLVTAIDRGVNSRDPFECTKYIQSAGRHAIANSLFQLTDQLLTLKQPNHTLVEKIDDILGQAMLHGDKKCRTRRKYWWSYRLHQECMWKSILKRRRSGLQADLDTTTVLQELMSKHRLSNRHLPNTVVTCSFQLGVVTREIKRLEAESFDARLEEKVAMAQIYDETGEKDRAKLVREISRSEQQLETFRMFQHIRNPTTTSSITQVDIPDSWPAPDHTSNETIDLVDPKVHAATPDATWRRITQPDEINYSLRLRNRRHFGQAHGTPFTVPPLSHAIDWSASTLTSEAILDGQASLDLSGTLAAMLAECKRRKTITDVTGYISPIEFESKFKKWRESTTTSPSGRHLGLYKALFRRHSLTNAIEIMEFQNLRASLIRTHLAIINYCLRFRYSLRRWQHIVNVMLLKKPGDYRIHQLRVIHIYEADFNFILGVKWRQLLHNADEQRALHRSQYGGRPGCEATTLSLMEELKTDITYCSRKPLINFDNAAAACYDRIITSFASLVSRSFGQHRDVCFVHAKTLELAKFRLKTALGISDEFYQHCEAYPIYGTGQGSGNSPAIWVFISSVLFTCHENEAYGAVFESPDRSVRVRFSMVGFVDDSTGQVNDFLTDKPPSLDALVRMMAHDAQLWNDLLGNSGGLLELSKCSYHILYFSFRRDGTPYMSMGTTSPELRVTDHHTKQEISIKRLLSFQSHETLGHYKASSGNQSAHLKILTKKGVTLARQLYKSSATRDQARIFYWSIYIPSIRYTLPQSFFSRQQLHDAQAKSFPMILAKTGFMRTMPYSIVFGPTHMGGAGYVTWNTLQGEGQIMLFVKHWRAYDDAGLLLRVALAWTQFQAGTSVPVLQDVSSRLPHVESRWIPALRMFLATINAKLVTDRTYVIPPQREGDEHIMDTIITIEEFTDKEIHILNCCRLYLNVVTISDLADVSGTKMDNLIAHHMPSFDSHSKLHTPVQERPANWNLWDVVMQKWFCADNKLRRPLGKWLYPGNRLVRTWAFYYEESDQCIYHRVVDGFVRYTRISRGYGIQEMSEWTPTSTSVPVAVIITSPGILHISNQISNLSPPSIPIANSFSEFVMTMPDWERPLLEWVVFKVQPYQFFEDLHNKPTPLPAAEMASALSTLHMVSDGSHTRDSMSFGWTMALADGTRIAECNGPGYGPGTSHRAEGYGMLSAVRFLFRLQEFLMINTGWAVRFVSDNQGLITRINNRLKYTYIYANSTLDPDWDIIEQIHATLQSIPISPTFVHVKGHQDELRTYEQLSLDEQMNVDADHLAGVYHEDFPSADCVVPMLPQTGVQVQIRECTITSRYSRHIRQAAGMQNYLSYVQTHNDWNSYTWETVDPVVLRRVIARHTHQYVNVVKMLHDYLPTSAIRAYTDSTVQSSCELCHAENSKFSHLLRCPHQIRSEWRVGLLQAVQRTCEMSPTRLGLMQAVLAGLKAWFSRSTVDPSDYSPEIRQAVIEQNEIGWYGSLRGLCSRQWASLQHQHLLHNNLQTKAHTGTAWLVSLVGTMWKHIFQLWDTYKTQVHGETQIAQRHKAFRRIQTKIRLLHDQAHAIRTADQRWLISDLDTYFQISTLSQMHRWYATYEPVIIDAIKIARDASVANMRSLRTYFPQTCPTRYHLKQAARLRSRQPRVQDARAQAKRRSRIPRPKSSPMTSIRSFFLPLQTVPEHSLVPMTAIASRP